MNEKKKELKIEWADSTAIDALETYVDELLDCLARVLKQSGTRHAFISDESCISDFLESEETGKKVPHPLDKSKMVNVVTADTANNRKLVAQISQELGVPVGLYDRVYEVAIRLRDR